MEMMKTRRRQGFGRLRCRDEGGRDQERFGWHRPISSARRRRWLGLQKWPLEDEHDRHTTQVETRRRAEQHASRLPRCTETSPYVTTRSRTSVIGLSHSMSVSQDSASRPACAIRNGGRMLESSCHRRAFDSADKDLAVREDLQLPAGLLNTALRHRPNAHATINGNSPRHSASPCDATRSLMTTSAPAPRSAAAQRDALSWKNGSKVPATR